MPERGQVARDPEPGPQRFEREARVFGPGGSPFGLGTAVDRHPAMDRRAGFDLAGLLEPADELPDPLGTGGVLAAQRGERPPGLEIG